MKNFFLVIAVSCFTFSFQAQNTAGIYDVSFQISSDLTNAYKVQFGNQTTSSTNSLIYFSDAMVDSIKAIIVKTVANQLSAQTEYTYRQTKKGRLIQTGNFGNSVRGLPNGTKRKAIRNFEKDYYVRVSINVSGRGGISYPMLDGQHSSLRPMITFRITAFDAMRKKVFNKRVKAKDFSKLKSVQRTFNNVTVKQSEVLHQEDIYFMLKKVVEQFDK